LAPLSVPLTLSVVAEGASTTETNDLLAPKAPALGKLRRVPSSKAAKRATSRAAAQPDRGRPVAAVRISQSVALGAIVLVAVLILGTVVLATVSNRDSHSVATVDGVGISRADLRGRIAVDAFISARRASEVDREVRAGRLTAQFAPGSSSGLLIPIPWATRCRS
jgi:hypothetical protein